MTDEHYCEITIGPVSCLRAARVMVRARTPLLVPSRPWDEKILWDVEPWQVCQEHAEVMFRLLVENQVEFAVSGFTVPE